MLQIIITSGIIYLAVLVVIFITANQDKPTDENVVKLHPIFLVIGIIGFVLFAALTVLMILKSEFTAAWVFLAIGVLSALMILGYFNNRIFFGRTSMTCRNLFRKKTVIDALKRSIKGMETLYEKNIAYKNVIAYSDFDKTNGVSAVANFINIFAIVVSILMAIKLSVSIPNEIKEGQARFTMITSVGRTYYVLFRWATELIRNLFAFIVFSLLCFAVVAMFYPTGGKYVLVATITNSFLLNYGASCFLQIVFGTYTLFLISAIAFSVSLVVRRPLLSAGITIVVCFCGRFLELLQSTIGRTVNFAKWLLPLNLRLEQSFTSLTVNSVFVTAIFGISITAFLFFIAMATFSKGDMA